MPDSTKLPCLTENKVRQHQPLSRKLKRILSIMQTSIGIREQPVLLDLKWVSAAPTMSELLLEESSLSCRAAPVVSKICCLIRKEAQQHNSGQRELHNTHQFLHIQSLRMWRFSPFVTDSCNLHWPHDSWHNNWEFLRMSWQAWCCHHLSLFSTWLAQSQWGSHGFLVQSFGLQSHHLPCWQHMCHFGGLTLKTHVAVIPQLWVVMYNVPDVSTKGWLEA